MATTKKVQLPDGFDPYDMRLKRQFSDQADKMNVIALSRKNYNLCCGAMHNGQPCKNPAGMGTPHKESLLLYVLNADLRQLQNST